MKRYIKSQQHLEEALKLIPLGSQTFSKSYKQYPQGASPYYIEKGKGAYVWDIDGNQYLDCINGLLAVSLGYCDEDVDAKVIEQLSKGVSFSLATTVELALAEKLNAHIPSAEMIRFGKNGSDVTSAAIRLARAYTKKNHILVCGYHGWHDWYIGSTTRDLGVPESTKELTHVFNFNDITSLQKLFAQYKGQVAAVIMEPMNTTVPQDGFLTLVKELTHDNDALLIFDEIISGFRFSMNGAQSLFKVTPDLSTFGKGIGNGFPISAIVGKKEYMSLMDELFFSSTFGGEALSLVASLAVIEKMERDNVLEHIHRLGARLQGELHLLIERKSLSHLFNISGHPAWSFLNFTANEVADNYLIKSYVMQEFMKRGVLFYGTHNLSYAYCEEDIDTLLNVYDDVLSNIKTHLDNHSLAQQLECTPLEPLFKVR